MARTRIRQRSSKGKLTIIKNKDKLSKSCKFQFSFWNPRELFWIPELFGSPRTYMGHPGLFWTPGFIWDPWTYLEPRDLFRTPWTIWDPGPFSDPQDLSHTPKTIKSFIILWIYKCNISTKIDSNNLPTHIYHLARLPYFFKKTKNSVKVSLEKPQKSKVLFLLPGH